MHWAGGRRRGARRLAAGPTSFRWVNIALPRLREQFMDLFPGGVGRCLRGPISWELPADPGRIDRGSIFFSGFRRRFRSGGLARRAEIHVPRPWAVHNAWASVFLAERGLPASPPLPGTPQNLTAAGRGASGSLELRLHSHVEAEGGIGSEFFPKSGLSPSNGWALGAAGLRVKKAGAFTRELQAVEGWDRIRKNPWRSGLISCRKSRLR
ncbi:hypothetical protein EDD22DRAFT_958509 [Suillus occidentalis]|nr:hypothetical protein EDD22DRAFT_958509 [Suillus occidentalis]